MRATSPRLAFAFLAAAAVLLVGLLSLDGSSREPESTPRRLALLEGAHAREQLPCL